MLTPRPVSTMAMTVDSSPASKATSSTAPIRRTYAKRFAAEMPHTELVRIPAAGHIPMENDPAAVARARVMPGSPARGAKRWTASLSTVIRGRLVR